MTAIFHWERMGDTLPKFERRVTLCLAANKKVATEALLRDAREYPTSDHIVFLGDYFIQELDDRPSKVPIEVAHELTIGVNLTTGVTIDPDQFLERHWGADRIESCGTLGFRHVWYNIDHLTSGCYNCKVVREGRLWEQGLDAKKEAK